MKKEVIRLLDKIIDRQAQYLSILCKDFAELTSMPESAKLTFRVNLHSLWSEGEKDVNVTGTGDLAKIIQRAENKFKKVNHRSDVQASYRIYVVFRRSVAMFLPEKLWKKYTQKAKEAK